jgi:threonine synthase
MVSDDEILQGIQLLAETEGIFTEPAGGATVAGAIRLVREGAVAKGDPIVICITGNGYKTADVLEGRTERPTLLGKGLSEFEDYLAGNASVRAD